MLAAGPRRGPVPSARRRRPISPSAPRRPRPAASRALRSRRRPSPPRGLDLRGPAPDRPRVGPTPSGRRCGRASRDRRRLRSRRPGTGSRRAGDRTRDRSSAGARALRPSSCAPGRRARRRRRPGYSRPRWAHEGRGDHLRNAADRHDDLGGRPERRRAGARAHRASARGRGRSPHRGVNGPHWTSQSPGRAEGIPVICDRGSDEDPWVRARRPGRRQWINPSRKPTATACGREVTASLRTMLRMCAFTVWCEIPRISPISRRSCRPRSAAGTRARARTRCREAVRRCRRRRPRFRSSHPDRSRHFALDMSASAPECRRCRKLEPDSHG